MYRSAAATAEKTIEQNGGGCDYWLEVCMPIYIYKGETARLRFYFLLV